MEMTHVCGNLGASPDIAIATHRVPAAVEAAPGSSMRLADLKTGAEARVVSVTSGGDDAPVDLGRRLAELGFLPGEKLRIVARGLLSREPIAVRIGTGTFALRLFEAACVRVSPEQSQ
jgi:ferrous iron transport protein A